MKAILDECVKFAARAHRVKSAETERRRHEDHGPDVYVRSCSQLTSTRLARAANFTHSSGIALNPHLLRNMLL